MIAVIVLPGPSPERHGLDAHRPVSLLPLGDRPMLQHIVESLVAQGITTIELIVGHAPEQVEAQLGSGDRWGCSFRYHLEVQPDRPYRSFKIITETKTEPWVLVHAEHYPCLEFPSGQIAQPVLYYGALNPRSKAGDIAHGATICGWGGTAVFPAGNWSSVFVNQTPKEMREYLERLESSAEATVVSTADWIDGSTPAAFLETQIRLLDRRLDGLLISGTERDPGIWVSRNVVIHPTAELVAPVYVGPNSRINRGVRLGPNAVIGGECIVDTNTIIEHSLVIAGSYVGEGLELSNTVVDRNLLINARLDTSVAVLESFLLGGLKQPRKQGWSGRALESMVALLGVLIFSPVLILSFLYFGLVRRLCRHSVQVVQLPIQQNTHGLRSYSLPCFDAGRWNAYHPPSWGVFVRQFLPGLLAVAIGRLSFVGLPPKTIPEIQNLSEEWHSLYLGGKAGLITESCIASTDPKDETQLYIADAYYTAKQSFLHDLKLACKYFLRLAISAY
jgi:NDP-sugar pyrophosphorylase family protein